MSEQKIAYYLNFSDVIRVLRLVDESPYQEFQLDLEGLKLHVVHDTEHHLPAQHAAASVSETARSAVAERAPEQVIAAAVTSAETSAEGDGKPVVAPLAGVFYRSPSPGAPPFVDVGAVVKAGDVVGILEIMKLMNYVTAPCAGVIRRICARNEEVVAFGQVLAVIDPRRVE